MEYKEKYQLWLESSAVDPDTKKELESLKENEKEIEDRFYRDLEFGTGGLRGIIGAGTNRINRYTVAKATQGLANYIKKEGEEAVAKGVVIAYDSRRKSEEFATEAALVLNANGIKAYIFKELMPTPILSFSVRHLNATAGIVITASHNPPEYNGYKVYWNDGGQIPPDRAEEIIEEIKAVDGFEKVQTMSMDAAKEKGLLRFLGEEILKEYLDRVEDLCIDKKMIQDMGRELKIIYTPLHGSGNKPVRRILKQIGFENVSVVPEQEGPDPDFSTVEYPNPEESAAFNLAIAMAKRDGADLIIGTDPDCDRVGVVAKDTHGEYIVLTGNQVGALLVDYILSALDRQGKLPANGKVIKTIVTSEMGRKIASSYGIETIDTLTGFKFIGEKIKEFEEKGDRVFLFGYEESYGYLAGNFVRDKDGVIASMLICEMAAHYKAKGMGLYEGLVELWKKYGCYMEALESIKMEGKEGMEKIQDMMDSFRNNPPAEVAGYQVVVTSDYRERVSRFLKEDRIMAIDLPKSNVLRYTLEDDSWFCIRPSGTEPKVKLYFSVIGEYLEDAEKKMKRLIDGVMKEIK